MTKQHFIRAAEQVKAILDGHWTTDLPDWALQHDWMAFTPLGRIEVDTENGGNVDVNVLRAIWTAEAYILLFQAYNPRFDVQRFLVACGLVDAPVKKGRV
jgi:hypothetical protein